MDLYALKPGNYALKMFKFTHNRQKYIFSKMVKNYLFPNYLI